MEKLLLVCLFFSLFLVSCEKKNKLHVEFDLDGGVFLDEVEYTKDSLPIPEKEGFFFVGWLYEDKIIDTLENQEYNLIALWIANVEYEFISDSELFCQNETDYFVYLMRDGCSWCEKIKDDILRYQYKTKLNDSLKKIYIVNLQTSKYSSPILRTYEEDESGFYISEANTWNELYIPSTPTLIEIKENEGIRKANLLGSGATVIKNILINSSKDTSDYSKKTEIYQITYELDGGTAENLVESFNKWEKVLLPIPTKEGYYFGGWMDNQEYVKEIQYRNYNLKAKWIENSNVEEISEEDIFNKEGSYYIYFLKNSDDNEKMLEFIKTYNALTDYYEIDQIYILDLEKCEVIYRAYVGGDSTNKVDGVNNIGDLYISQRKCMIYVDETAKFIAGSNKAIISYFEEITGLDFSELK